MFGNEKHKNAFGNTQPKFKSPRRETKTQSAPAIVEEDFGNYRIKAGKLDGTYVARAFPKTLGRVQGVIAEAKAGSAQQAIEALKDYIKARDLKRTEDRRWEQKAETAVPNTDEYIEALRQANLPGAQVAMLKAHALAAEEGLTASQLASAAGYKSRDMATKVMKRAGVLISGFLAAGEENSGAVSGDGAARILAYQKTVDDGAAPIWVMHQELREAVGVAL